MSIFWVLGENNESIVSSRTSAAERRQQLEVTVAPAGAVIEYRRRFRMQIEGRVFSQTIQDTDFPDPTSWRKTFKLCIRLGGKILKAVDDVINDVTSDVIFHTKKLILNPFLHIKGGKYEGSRFHTHERASSGLSKNRSRFANRPS